MSSSTIYLVTGANRPRGIDAVPHTLAFKTAPLITCSGFGLVAHILAKHENSFVYAGARSPENAIALHELKTKYPGRIEVVKCISGDTERNATLAKEIEERHGRIDTVIANAAIWSTFAHIDNVTSAEMQEHFQISFLPAPLSFMKVNVMGPIVLCQAMLLLLKKSPNPKFVPISSIGGCLGADNLVVSTVGGVCYGSTKAALNWVTRKIHFENDWIVAFPMSPGGVSTDLLSDTRVNDLTGIFKTFLTGNEPTAEEAAALIMKVIDESTRESSGGKFMHLDGSTLPW